MKIPIMYGNKVLSYACRNILYKAIITSKGKCYKNRQWDKSIVKYMAVTIKDKEILPCI